MQRYKQGFILAPLVMSPTNVVADVQDAKKKYGFSGIPITANGQMGGKLLGLVTQRDIDFLGPDKNDIQLSEVSNRLPKSLHE